MLLADLPDLQITFAAGSASAWVEIGYEIANVDRCALLHESFRATIGDAEMAVSEPGAVDGIDHESCRFPTLRITPPASRGVDRPRG